MRSLETFVLICRTALDPKSMAKDRDACMHLIRLRARFTVEKHGAAGSAKAEQLRTLVLDWHGGRAQMGAKEAALALCDALIALPEVEQAQPYYLRD